MSTSAWQPVRGWAGGFLLAAVVFAALTPALRIDPGDDARERLERAGWAWGIAGQPQSDLLDLRGPVFEPLAWIALHMGVRALGAAPVTWLAILLLVHALNVGLLYAAVLRLAQRAPSARPAAPAPDVPGRTGPDERVRGFAPQSCAAAAALLFGLHPLRIGTLAAPDRPGALLACTCLLGAVCLYANPGPRRTYAGTGVLALLALAASPAALGFPFALLALEWWRRRSGRGEPRVVRILLAGVVAAIASAALAAAYLDRTNAWNDWTLTDRLALGALGPVFTLWKTAWPLPLLPFYEAPRLWPLSSPLVLTALVGIPVMLLGLVAAARRHRGVAAAGFAFLALSIPLGLLNSGPGLWAAADSYVASLPLAALLGVGLIRRARQASGRSVALAGSLAGLMLAAVLGFMSLRNAELRRNASALWAFTTENSHVPGLPRAGALSRLARAREFDRFGEPERVVQLCRLAAQARPDLLPAYWLEGDALARAGDLAGAQNAFERVLRVAPDSAATYTALGQALAAAGVADRAEAALRRSIQLDPGAWQPRIRLGHLLLATGRAADAADQFRAALEKIPGNAELHADLQRAMRGA